MTVAGLAIGQEARKWIGTPYHHQESLLGVGCDCLGLLRGVYRDVVGPEPKAIPNYSHGWDEVARREDMLNTCRSYLCEVDRGCRASGTVLVFRMRPTAVAKHCGIMVTDERFVHSHSGRGTVEIELSGWWAEKIVAAFEFPGVS